MTPPGRKRRFVILPLNPDETDKTYCTTTKA